MDKLNKRDSDLIDLLYQIHLLLYKVKKQNNLEEIINKYHMLNWTLMNYKK